MTRKRGAAIAAGSLLLGLSLVPVSASAGVAGTMSCRAVAVFPSVWSGGFDFQFVITNTGTEPFNLWTVAWDMPSGDTISTIWNGEVTQQGRHVIATNYNTPYNTSVPPGGSVSSFGGVVEGNGGTGFTNITCSPGWAPVPVA